MVIKTVGKVYEAIDIFFGRLLRYQKSWRYDLTPPIHCLLDRPAADLLQAMSQFLSSCNAFI